MLAAPQTRWTQADLRGPEPTSSKPTPSGERFMRPGSSFGRVVNAACPWSSASQGGRALDPRRHAVGLLAQDSRLPTGKAAT